MREGTKRLYFENPYQREFEARVVERIQTVRLFYLGRLCFGSKQLPLSALQRGRFHVYPISSVFVVDSNSCLHP